MVLAMQTASEYLEISSVQLTFFAGDKSTQNKMKLLNKLEDKYPELLNWMGKRGEGRGSANAGSSRRSLINPGGESHVECWGQSIPRQRERHRQRS